MLAIPTALLASAPDITTFTILRVTQGLCMASAFTLTLAYLGEECSATDAGGAFAAYITGNVASNLIGRMISAGVADHFGLAANFYFFSALNLAGAVLVYFTIRTTMPIASGRRGFVHTGRDLVEALAQSAIAGELWHRILYLVRLYRDLYLRKLRACTGATSARPHGAWVLSISYFCLRS